jgi:hypothetical protein
MANKHESIEWCDIRVTGADGNARPKVLLVGDSIAASYFFQVEKNLAGKFDCARMATSACLCSSAFRKQLGWVLGEFSFRVVHFNNGLHGMACSEASYARSFPQILDFIGRRSRSSRLIWASSTPVRRVGALNEFAPETDRVRARNRIAAEHAAARGIPINDLFARMEHHPEYHNEDAIHFNPEGAAILGDQVAQCILANA